MEPDFDFFWLFELGEHFQELHLLFKQQTLNDAAHEEQFEKVYLKAEDIRNILEESNWGDVIDRLEGEFRTIAQINAEAAFDEAAQREFDFFIRLLKREIRNEVSLKGYIEPPKIPPSVSRSILLDIRLAFHLDTFEELPEIAQLDLIEAGRSYSNGQFTAAAILGWRAAEATYKMYFERFTGSKYSGRPGWFNMIEELRTFTEKPSNPDLIDELHTGRKMRNLLAHPNRTMDANYGWTHLRRSIGIMTMLINNLNNREIW